MTNPSIYVPTLTRYAVLILATKLVSGGVIPQSLAAEITKDPLLLEMVSGVVLFVVVGVSYFASNARAALKAAFD